MYYGVSFHFPKSEFINPLPYGPCAFIPHSRRGVSASPYGPEAAFQIHHSPFNSLCPPLFCNHLIAILNVGISQHHIGIDRGFFKRLVLSNSQGDVINRLTGPNA